MATLSLAELRRARDFTQVRLAESLGKRQSAVSRIEREADLYVSTLRSYVEAMGGELRIEAVFPDGAVPAISFGGLRHEAGNGREEPRTREEIAMDRAGEAGPL